MWARGRSGTIPRVMTENEIAASISARVDEALHRARRHAEVSYAEVRWVRERKERLFARDRRLDEMAQEEASGFGVRVLARGAWGFACTPIASPEALSKAVDSAIAVAIASARVAISPVHFPERSPEVGRYETPYEIDPFALPLDRKIADLLAPLEILLGSGKPIESAEAWMSFSRVHKLLATSEGTRVEQHFLYGGAGMMVIAVGDDGRSQRRTYPSFRGAEAAQAGYEIVESRALTANAERLRSEAIALLHAPPCPERRTDIILASDQLALQIHESAGHPTELDRALGTEISLAGGSFLQPSMLGKFRYGSDLVTIVADSTTQGGLGTFGWDDEGTRARKAPLVKDGIFVDYLSSRESAAALSRESTGTMRADGFARIPLVRMVNVSLEPREGSLEDLIADTRDGILFETNKSWSIDDLRLDFQFGCEMAWEIKNGKRARLLRDATYAGRTPDFWRSCDAIAGPEEFRLWGITTCGKGAPMQLMQVGHGASPARFRSVEVRSS